MVIAFVSITDGQKRPRYLLVEKDDDAVFGANSTVNTLSSLCALCATRPILTIQISYQWPLSQQLSVFSVVISAGLIDL